MSVSVLNRLSAEQIARLRCKPEEAAAILRCGDYTPEEIGCVLDVEPAVAWELSRAFWAASNGTDAVIDIMRALDALEREAGIVWNGDSMHDTSPNSKPTRLENLRDLFLEAHSGPHEFERSAMREFLSMTRELSARGNADAAGALEADLAEVVRGRRMGRTAMGAIADALANAASLAHVALSEEPQS